MRSKAPLPLIEQLIMVLVFALAAALCLQGFALSDRTSLYNENRDQAVLLAQNTAEVCKLYRGDASQIADTLGGEAAQNAYTAYYDADLLPSDAAQAAYTVRIAAAKSDIAGLGRATVSVYGAGAYGAGDEDKQTPLFELPVAWQEVRVNE